MSTWADKEKEYLAQGFSVDQINQQRDVKYKEYIDNGVDVESVKNYFGIKNPDESLLSSRFEENLKSYQPKEADDLLEAISAGLQVSVPSLLKRAYKGQDIRPDTVVPEHADTYLKVASGIATVVGDVPATIAGYIGGKVVGAPLSGAVSGGNPVATAIGSEISAQFGANAAPEFLRTALMEYYSRGEMQRKEEFTDVLATTLLKTIKAGSVGVLTFGAGKAVKAGGEAISDVASAVAAGAGQTVSTGFTQGLSKSVGAAKTATEIVTMTTAAKALEGELPNFEDFTTSAAIIGTIGTVAAGVSYSPKAVKKLQNIYAKTGVRPEQVAEDAATNPALKIELLSNSDQIPKQYSVDGKPLLMSTFDKEPVVKADVEPIKPSKPLSPNLSKIKEVSESTPEGMTSEKLYTYFVDKLHPVKKISDTFKKLSKVDATESNAYELMRMFPDYKAKLKSYIENGTLQYGNERISVKPFTKIIEQFDKDSAGIDGFKDYLISSRALELDKRGIKHGFDSEYSANYVRENKSKYESAANDWYKFNDTMIDYLASKGLYSKDQVQGFKDLNRNYISFKRIITDEGGAKLKSGGKVIKGIKGSERDIQDPFLSMLENFELYMKTAEKNEAYRKMWKEVQKIQGEDSEIISVEKTVMKPIKLSDSEKKSLVKSGLSEDEADSFTVFRPMDRTLGKNQIAIYEEGKRIVLNINDDLLAESVKSMDFSPSVSNPIFQFAAAVTRIKKVGISLTPEFIARNSMRDFVTSGIMTEADGVSLKEVIVAAGDILKKNEEYYRWLESGGANGAFMEMGERYLKDSIYKSAEFISARDRAMNVVKSPLQFMEFLGNLAEQSTRLAEQKRVSGAAESGIVLRKGGMASREITIDFQRVGLKVQAANQIISYLNASIQGLDKTVRAFKKDPAKFSARAGALVTLPSLMLWYANKDDERYQNLPQWQKDLFWIIPTDDWQDAEPSDNWQNLPKYLVKNEGGKVQINRGTVWRIPKPLEIGLVFGSIPERIANSFYKDKPAGFELKEALLSAVIPNVMPDVVAPIAEQMTNKSFFTGSSLVPFQIEGVLPEDQYVEYTSETGRLIGQMIGYVPFIGDLGPSSAKLSSPIVVDNYIRQWTGTTGQYLLQLTDAALKTSGYKKTEVEPEKTLADIPFIRAFVARNPSFGMAPITEFLKKSDELSKYKKSLDIRLDRMDFGSAKRLLEDHSNKVIGLDGFRKAMSAQTKFIRNVYYNPKMSPEEKRQAIDSAYYQMAVIAEAGLKVTRQIEENGKQLKQEGIEP